MSYESSEVGRYEPAQLGVFYRALKLQSDAVAVDITVTSGVVTGIALHLEPAEVHSGSTIITAGTLTGLLGYPREPNSGNS